MPEAGAYLEHPRTRSFQDAVHEPLDRMPALDAANPACLNARERRAMLEDIGHVALVLGRSLRPAQASCEPGGNVPASPAPARVDALTSPLERLHFLCGLWTRMAGALNEIARQPDSRATTTRRQISIARSRGGAATATALARSPASAAAWQILQADQSRSLRPVPCDTPPRFSMPHISQASASPVGAVGEGRNAESPSIKKPRPNAPPGERALVSEPVLASTQNTWANRMVVSLLKDMAQEAKALARLASFCDDETAFEKAAGLADVAGRLLADALRRGCPALRANEYDPPFAADLIARSAPAYGVVYHGWRALHHPLDFDWTHAPMLALPSLEAWHLYEIWCCLQVATALLGAGWQLEAANAQGAGESAHPLLRCTPQGLRLNMATGRASRLRFRKINGDGRRPNQRGRRKQDAETLDLYYQPLFSSANQAAFQQASGQPSQQTSGIAFPAPPPAASQPTNRTRNARAVLAPAPPPDSSVVRRHDLDLAFESRSHAMQPDIALHWRGALTLLDPKYRRYAQPSDAQDDINKMHTYRDAIVTRTGRGHKTASKISGVQAAWCLFPGSSAQDASSIEKRTDEMQDREPGSELTKTVYAYPTASAEHPFGTAGVGAFGLRPGQPDTLPRLAAFLTILLDTA